MQTEDKFVIEVHALVDRLPLIQCNADRTAVVQAIIEFVSTKIGLAWIQGYNQGKDDPYFEKD